MKSVLEELEIMFPKNSEDESDEGSNADSDFSGDEAKKKKKSGGAPAGAGKGGAIAKGNGNAGEKPAKTMAGKKATSNVGRKDDVTPSDKKRK